MAESTRMMWFPGDFGAQGSAGGAIAHFEDSEGNLVALFSFLSR